jgi:hypothetical protein
MRKEKANYSVSMMARVLGVSRSGFYRRLKVGGGAGDPWGPLKKAIVRIWDASGRRFRPHKSIGDRVPAEAMQELFGRFKRILQFSPKVMLAA